MIRTILDIYILIIIADVILSFLPQFHRENWALQIAKVAGFTLDPVRKILPRDLPMDFSPLVVIMGINLLKVLW